jgi:two-component system sensor histidine kinase/response regulator
MNKSYNTAKTNEQIGNRGKEPVFQIAFVNGSELKILILEDNQNDVDLLYRELKKSGLSFISRIVQTREEYENALENFGPDIILSDYSLPTFDAVTAFRIKQEKSPYIPFIIVSGIIGEENAVELIKNGVTDYTPKDKLFTLSPKINRALKDSEERKEKNITAEKLKIQAAELTVANRELEKQEKKLNRTNEELLHLNQHLENRVFERTGELEKLIHELKDLSLSKDVLLAVISHDLRNPLAVLLLASEELSNESENNIFDPIQPYVKIIHRSSLNILQQLNELVNWAKSQQEKASLHLEKINLFSAVNQSFELLKINASQKNITLENKVPDDFCIIADALMLRSILQNLVTNSIKYSLEAGLVKVTAQQIDSLAEVCIVDSGMGMDDNTRENLFTRSNGTSVSGTNNEMGSGLGLLLVKDFVSQLGGKLRVESELRNGTCIYFTVPAYTQITA